MVVSGRATRRERTRASSSGASVHGTADRLSRRVGRRLRRRVLLARNWCPGRGCAQPLVWPPFRSETTETRARPWEGRERGRSTVGRAREGPAAACAVGNKRWSTMYEDGRGCAPAAPRLRAARAAGGIGRSGVRRRSLRAASPSNPRTTRRARHPPHALRRTSTAVRGAEGRAWRAFLALRRSPTEEAIYSSPGVLPHCTAELRRPFVIYRLGAAGPSHTTACPGFFLMEVRAEGTTVTHRRTRDVAHGGFFHPWAGRDDYDIGAARQGCRGAVWRRGSNADRSMATIPDPQPSPQPTSLS